MAKAARKMAKALTQPDIVLRAIHPSAALEDWYRQALQRLVRRMSRSMLLHLRAAHKRGDFALDANADGVVSLRDALEEWAPRWVSNFDKLSERVSRLFANKSASDLDRRMMRRLKDAGFAIEFKPTKAMRQAYKACVSEQVNLIKSIPAQFLKDVRTSVWHSVMAGGDLSTLTASLQKNYGVAHRRAALIARDQTAKARSVFERARRAELGITEAIWVHSGGGSEPRPEHVKWGHERARFEVKRGMWSEVDKQYVFPGTPINCRCVSRAIVPGLHS